MFEGLFNFLQGHGWISNAQLDEDKRKKRIDDYRAQDAAGKSQKAQVSSPSQGGASIETPSLPNILQKPQQNEQPQQNGFLKGLRDFTAQANDALYGGIARGGANIVNSIATGFNGEETRKRTEDFLRSIGQSDENGQSQLARGTDKNSTAGRIGQAIGGTEKLVAETVPSLLLPAGAAIKATQTLPTAQRVATVATVDAGIGGAFGAGQSMSQGNGGQDILRDTAIGAGLGAGLGAGTALADPFLQRAIERANRRSNPTQVASTVKTMLFRNADELEQAAESASTSTLGKIDDGISSEAQAAAKRQDARFAAQSIREQASQIPNEAPQTRQITTQDIRNPETAMVLQKATPEQLLARDAAGDVEATAEIQRRFDETQAAVDADTVAPTPEAPVAQVVEPAQQINNRLESPTTRASREIAETSPPVVPDEFIDVSRAGTLNDEARWFADDPEFAGSFIPADDGTGRSVLPAKLNRADVLDTFDAEQSSQLRSLLGDEFFDDAGRLRSIITENRDSDLRLQQALNELGRRGVRVWDEAGGSSYYFPGGNREAYSVGGSTVDPRISQLYQEAEQHLSRADEILARDGTDVAALGEKLYVADANNTPAQLTRAEQEAFDYLNSNINDAERVLMSQGIIDKDLGVRRDYLPTGDEAGIERVFTPEDINASTFNYAKGRSGGFIKDDGTVSDKLPKGIRAAYTDYYVRGKGSQYLSDAQVDDIKSTRIAQTDMNDMMLGQSKEPLSGIDGKPAKIDSEPIRKNAEELVSLERKYSAAVKSGDEKAIQKLQAEVNQKTIDNSVAKLTQMKKQINDLISETNASNLTREQKTARIVELENRLDYAEKQARYQQSYVKTNLLFQIPGRVADQVGKLTQSIGDALTAPLASRATKTFRPTTQEGRKAARTVARDANLNERRNNYQLNKQLNDATANNVLQKVGGRYTAAGTRVTELGSRQKAPIQDTARYFAAQAETNGAEDITAYIRNAVGTKEWERVYNQFNTSRNRFSGVGDITGSVKRGVPGVKKGFANEKLDDVKKWLNNSIDKAFATTLPRSVRRNMADAISIPLVGFPRVVWNVGAKGMDYATFGLSNLYKASRINVVDDATALQKALILRDAIDGAAAGTGLVGLGVLLGQSDMITGPEPEKQANGEWIPPYSLKLGNDYVELGRFIGPYAVPIMLAAAISRGDAAKNIASVPALVTSQVMNNFGADSIGDTMSQMGDVLNGDWSGLARKLPNMLSAFAPFSSQINSIANATDPYQRDTKDDNAFVQFMQQLASKVPGLRQQLDVKEDQFGNKIPSSPLKAVLPISTVGSGWGESELGQEANRLELKPSGNSNTQENAEDMASRLIKSEWYQGLNDEDKKSALQSTLYSGKLGDINDNLSDAAKDALAIGTLMSPDDRNKWLEDATNARDYHVANYENAVENGTLTAKQDSLENSSSLHYKAVASQVNAALPYWDAELEQLYKETSKTELYAMSPDNPIRQKLLALDAARAKAGVSLKSGDHSANKYGDGTGGSGRGGKNFSFASSTAANAEKSGFQQPNVKAGFDATLVKPLGIGEASQSVKRKISVKRGVQL